MAQPPRKGVSNEHWACLSYSWGSGDQRVMNKKETLNRHLRGIPFALLPNTTRDAVIVCRSLSIRYLWVDALCIIQDDKNDSERELGIMGEIYRYALITIVAASARHVEEGFLYDKGYYYSKEGSAPPIRLPCLNTKGIKETVLAFEHIEKPEHALDFRNHTDTRGWCFQERVLSPRVLYYGANGLSYICQTMVLTNGNEGIADDVAEYKNIPRNSERRVEKLEQASLASSWMQIVEDYSARDLGRPLEDKLKAISGVAKLYCLAGCEFETGSQVDIVGAIMEAKWKQRPGEEVDIRGKYVTPTDRYVAGLMKTTPSLTWYINSDVPLKPRSTEYRAPSWSWAAVDSKVKYWANDKYVPSRYDVIDGPPTMHSSSSRYCGTIFSVTPQDANLLLRPVRTGSLEILKGMLTPVLCGLVVEGRANTIKTKSGSVLRVFPASEEANQVLLSDIDLFYAVLLMGDKETQWCGLVLQLTKTTRGRPMSYRRIGFWRCCDIQYHGRGGLLRCESVIKAEFPQAGSQWGREDPPVIKVM